MRATSTILLAAMASAQTPPAFDFADVHVSPHTSDMRASDAAFRAGWYEIHRANLVELILTAYNVEYDHVIGGPSWLEADRFDVIAKTVSSTSPETALLMFQTLLADRFKLVAHKEARPLPAFVLTLGKGKLKLKESDGSGETGCVRQQPTDSRPYAVLSCHDVTMKTLAQRLTVTGGAYLAYPVIDSSGLKGTWDFEIGWTPKAALQRAGGDGVSIFDAVEKLGLNLEQRDIPTPVIVVDSVNQKPTDNPPGANSKVAPSQSAEFEVAVLKLSAPDEQPGGNGYLPGGRLDFRVFPLRALIMLAWDIPSDQELPGEPKWLDTTFVDLVAKVTVDRANTPIALEDLRPLLRSLLTDRFRIRTHYEDRPVDAYTLIAVKPKLHKADPASRARCKVDRVQSVTVGSPLLQAVCQNISMAQFADQLPSIAPSYLHYLVPDATGIEGDWDFTLTFSLVPPSAVGGRSSSSHKEGGVPAPNSAGTDAAPDPFGGVSLFDALTHQLGLRLQMQKRSMPVLVLDHIEEKPTEN